MPVSVEVKIKGIDELAAGLKGFKRSLQRKYLRPHLFSSMRLLEGTIRYNAPVLNTANRGARWMLKVGARKKGFVKQNIRTRWSALQQKRGDAGVWTTVTRPKTSRAALRAASAAGRRKLLITSRRKGGFTLIKAGVRPGARYWPNDPFYFKFLEQGTKHIDRNKFQFIGKYAAGLQGEIVLRTFIKRAAAQISSLTAKDTK